MWAVAGSEGRTLELYRRIRERARVRLWSMYRPHPHLSALAPIEPIEPWRLRFPRGGTLVFVGVYYRYGNWVHLSGASRRIIVYNSPHPHILRRRVRKLGAFGIHRVEVVHASRWLREESGLDGPVQPSPIDLRIFSPQDGRGEGPFVVGRLSRSQPEKHNERDPALYGQLVKEGFAVRIMGGEVIRQHGPLDPRVEILPEGARDPAEFLHGLDCFLYRTSDRWKEPHGRVVQEAMACGLPVVCGRSGGMAEYVEHGRNGFLFDTDREALEIVRSLRADKATCRRVGLAARNTMEHILSAESIQRTVDFYLHGRPPEDEDSPFEPEPIRADSPR